MIVAADPAAVFANAYTRYQWKEAALLRLLERTPFHQCLVFLNSRARWRAAPRSPSRGVPTSAAAAACRARAHRSDLLTRTLNKHGWHADVIEGRSRRRKTRGGAAAAA